MKEKIEEIKENLEHILEYWNGAYELGAMQGALDEILTTAEETLKIAEQTQTLCTQEKVIDWEQRRYEIAKDLLIHNEFSAEQSVELADKLIKNLKD